MRTVIKDKMSSWAEVTSGVPQGSVLAPIMFLTYVNDMMDGVRSYASMFADDTKIMRQIKSLEDCVTMQEDLDKIFEWSKEWEMEFNTKKCKVLKIGKGIRRPNLNYRMGTEEIVNTREEKDLGVTVQDNLAPERHINRIAGETYKLLRNIRAAFNYLDENMMKLIVAMIRPRLEYAAVVWSPHKKKDIHKIERIQRAATKLVPGLRDLSYKERLQRLNLPTLEDRRERGDLITVYKVMKGMGKIDKEDLFSWDTRATRGHGVKLKKTNCRRDIKKYSFPYRTVDAWNSLDKDTVLAKTIHDFKYKLDCKRYGDRTP